MLKKLLLLLSFLTTFVGKAQIGSASIVGEYSENLSIRNYSGGLQAEIDLGDNITLNYKVVLGASSDKAFYLHAPLGAAVGTVILQYLGSSSTSAINALGAILICIPEGITFYPNPDAKIRTGFYISPLGCDYWKKRSNYEYFKLSGEIGARIKFPITDKIDLMAQGGVRCLYTKKNIDPLFIHAGGGISFVLGK